MYGLGGRALEMWAQILSKWDMQVHCCGWGASLLFQQTSFHALYLEIQILLLVETSFH